MNLFATGRLDDGLRLLLGAISKDLDFKQKAGLFWLPKRRRKKPRRTRQQTQRPPARQSSRTADELERVPAVSLRLYDLLAKQAIQGNRMNALSELTEFIVKHKLDAALRSRITAWSAASGR